ADEHERVSLLELVDGLLDELVTIDNHSYALTSGDSPAGNLGEDHRLAGAGWKRDRRGFGRIVFPVLLDRLDTLELVRPQLHLLLLARNRATILLVANSHTFALLMVDPCGRSGLVKATFLVERQGVKRRRRASASRGCPSGSRGSSGPRRRRRCTRRPGCRCSRARRCEPGR